MFGGMPQGGPSSGDGDFDLNEILRQMMGDVPMGAKDPRGSGPQQQQQHGMGNGGFGNSFGGQYQESAQQQQQPRRHKESFVVHETAEAAAAVDFWLLASSCAR